MKTIPGPREEQEVIRRIFRLFVRENGSFNAVARQLNEEGVPTDTGRPWRPKRIAYIIRNELCVGVYTYNKSNRMMRQTFVRRPEEEWIRVRVGPPVVSRALFNKASRLAHGWRNRYTDKELLRRLKRLLKRKGHLTPDIIDAARDTPAYMTYVQRFGSISRAYEAIGYAHHGRHRWKPELNGWWTDEAILAAVRKLHDEHGYVSSRLLRDTPGAPSATLIHVRFGGLLPCYAAAGIPTTLSESAKAAIAARPYRTRKPPDQPPVAVGSPSADG